MHSFLFVYTDIYQRSLIVKRQLQNLATRKLFRADRAFANEIIAYTKIMPQFHQFADSIELPIPFVDCLFAGADDVGDLIVLDDLKPFGYRMANRLKGLDYMHCKIALQVIQHHKFIIFFYMDDLFCYLFSIFLYLSFRSPTFHSIRRLFHRNWESCMA